MPDIVMLKLMITEDSCCNCVATLCIMNTFFQHRDVHKYTWYRDSFGQQSLIDSHIVSADLFRSVLDVRVKRGAELSTDPHLVEVERSGSCSCIDVQLPAPGLLKKTWVVTPYRVAKQIGLANQI